MKNVLLGCEGSLQGLGGGRVNVKLGAASTTEWSQDSNAWGSSLEKKVDKGLTSLAAHLSQCL